MISSPNQIDHRFNILLWKAKQVTPNTVFDPAERVNMRGVANLTQVLDNWKFDIMSQVKGILQNDHQSVLPDYARYQKLHSRTVLWCFLNSSSTTNG